MSLFVYVWAICFAKFDREQSSYHHNKFSTNWLDRRSDGLLHEKGQLVSSFLCLCSRNSEMSGKCNKLVKAIANFARSSL